MAADDPPGPAGPLQFDRVDLGPPGADAAQPAVTCRACGDTIRTQYFSMGGAPLCESCKTAFERSRTASANWATFGRAAMFGAGATVAGAALYYAVLAITKLEIGLVAIVIGYMVGWAVRRGSRGWGGRRYQVLALGLTYYSVGLAYLPLVMFPTGDPNPKTVTMTTTDPAVQPPAPEATARRLPAHTGPSLVRFATAASVLLMFCFALPVMTIVGSMPGGLISAIIIGVGMQQAWRMTAAPPIDVTGPYRVGAGSSSA
jgi:hypothetical protein